MPARRLLLTFAGSLLLGSPATAAQEGAYGATSKGEITITVSVASRVALSAARTSAATNGDGQTACLWLGTATHGYAVTALDGPIVWRPSATSSAGRAVAARTTLANLSSPAARPDCGRDPSLFVGYQAASASARPATLLIAPE